VLGTKETLLTLIPREDGLLVQTMFFADEIKALPQGYAKPAVVDAELAMAKQLISGMVKPFAPEEYKDEFQGRLRDLISTKIAGKEVVAVSGESSKTGNVIDIMEALKASIEQNKAAKPTRRKKKGA
jgi:DNA end-binding protein Ku